jgi:mercuric ion transport protein
VTVLFVGSAFYSAYRPLPADACTDGTCTPQSRRVPRLLAWIAAVIAAVLVAFPYYIGWLV